MNKKKILIPATACLVLSAVLLSGCKAATTAIGLSANWNQDTTIKTIAGGVKTEKLEYEVTFDAPKKATDYAVNYETGSYTTTLSSEMYSHGEDLKETAYIYTTEYKISLSFTVKGQKSETFEDYIKTTVWFADLDNSLRPIKSEKSGHTYTPVRSTPQSLDDAYYAYYDYTHTVVYDNPLTKATISQTVSERYSNQSEPTEKTVENQVTTVKAENFFDNEQLIFVLRAFDMGSAETVSTINPNAVKTTTKLSVTAPSSVSQPVKFTLTENGTTTTVEENIDAYSTTLGMKDTMKGSANKLIYAAKTNALNNTYHNLLLCREVPLFSSLGTLKYSLTKAEYIYD